jgi:hypothetical protein
LRGNWIAAIIEIIKDIRADKWKQRVFIILIGTLIGFLYTFVNHNTPLGEIPFFAITTISVTYLLFIYLEGHKEKIDSILGENSKKIVNNKVFTVWVYVFIGWLALGGIIVTQLHNIGFTLTWVYSVFAFVTVYPCLASSMIYFSAFKYLRVENQETTKKTIFNSLTIGTVGLASPWIFAILLILAFLSSVVSISVWIYYTTILTVYLGIFFTAIYLPYYQSMEDIKERKLKELQTLRQTLIESINGNNIHQHAAIELSIQRVDRDIQTVTSKSAHPYSIMKSLGAFVIVVILGGMLANILGGIIKVFLKLG